MKDLDPVSVLAVTEVLDDERDVGAVLGRQYPRLHRALADRGAVLADA